MNAFRRCIAATSILLMAAACSGTESSGTTGTSGTGASGGAAAGAGGGAGSGGNAGGGTTGTSGTGGSGGAAAGAGGAAGSGGNAGGGSIDASIDAPDAAKADVSSDAPRETGAPDTSSDGRVACQNSMWTAGDTTGNLSFGGQNRTYVLHVPAGYTGMTLVPLVLDFHGLGGTAAQEKSGSGWVTQSNQNGFVVVHPQGVGNSWNLMSGAGGCCPPAFDQNIDDVGFVRALIDKLKSEGCVDPKRIYATGLSNGGGMTLRLACDAADVIAAIAPYACDLFVSQPCAPSRPIAMIDYRGTSDNVVPYAGGVITIPVPGETRQITFLGATQTFEKIRNLNGCTGTPQTTHGNCSTYATCNQGVETTLCTVQNGGHTWGDSSVAWSVLRNHTLP